MAYEPLSTPRRLYEIPSKDKRWRCRRYTADRAAQMENAAYMPTYTAIERHVREGLGNLLRYPAQDAHPPLDLTILDFPFIADTSTDISTSTVLVPLPSHSIPTFVVTQSAHDSVTHTDLDTLWPSPAASVMGVVRRQAKSDA